MNRADGGDDIVMVYHDIRDGCRTWEWTMKDFELAISELLDQYRNKIPRQKAIDALVIQCNLVVGDETWSDEPPAAA